MCCAAQRTLAAYALYSHIKINIDCYNARAASKLSKIFLLKFNDINT